MRAAGLYAGPMGRKLLILGIGIGVGYVFGTRAGREQYDRMVASARGVWEDPRVAKVRADVEAYARTQAPVVKERAGAFAKAVPERVTDSVQRAAEAAADLAGRTTVVAHDIAGRTTIIAHDAVDKAKSALPI